MDIFYYSNYCKHCQRVVQFIVKHGLIDKISSICIDKRKRDVNNNQSYVILEHTNERVFLPPNLQSVPAVLCVKRNYTLVVGADPIIQYLSNLFTIQQQQPHGGLIAAPTDMNHPHVTNPGRPQQKDPISYDVMTASAGTIVSEMFTSYSLQPDDLEGNSRSKRRPLYNYTPVDTNFVIPTPEDTYRPDKVASNITIDILQQQRNQEVPVTQVGPPNGLYAGHGQSTAPAL